MHKHSPKILVFGNQKSGTTIIAALLAKSLDFSVQLDFLHLYKDLESAIFRDEVSPKELRITAQRHLQKDIIKDPSFIFLSRKAEAIFPQSKHLAITRHPLDNIRSILNRLKIPATENSRSPSHIIEKYKVPPAWRNILNGSDIQRKTDDYIDNLALRCRDALDTIHSVRDKCTILKYEDFVKDKVFQIEHTVEKLGYKPALNIANEVDRQYQPRGNKSIPLTDFFGTSNLIKIDKICRYSCENFQYAIEPKSVEI